MCSSDLNPCESGWVGRLIISSRPFNPFVAEHFYYATCAEDNANDLIFSSFRAPEQELRQTHRKVVPAEQDLAVKVRLMTFTKREKETAPSGQLFFRK